MVARTRRSRAAAHSPGDGHPLLAVRLPAWRSKLILFLLFAGFITLAGRAVYLQGGFGTEFLQQQGQIRYARTLEVAATRGRITDRNGVVLAASVPAQAVWAIPDDVTATPEQVAQLAKLLELPPAELRRRLEAEDRSFVYLRRQVEPALAARIAEMKLEGIHASPEFKRQYPEGPTAAHVVGFTNADDRGQEGVERVFDAQLAGRAGSRTVIKDRLGRVVDGDWLRVPTDGADLALSLDNRIQYIAQSALKQAVEQHRAKGAAAVVLDARSGEVLALANWPSYDPNRRAGWNPQLARNRVLVDTFEPGSTLKPFAVAAALERGLVTPEQMIQTAPGRLTIGNRTIGDTHPHGLLTVAQVVAKSSNVGTVKIALDLPAQTLWETYTNVGFGQAPRVGFPGSAAGSLRPYKAWRPIEQATIAYGYGVSVSLMQLARAYLVFARDGDLVPVTLTRLTQPPAAVQVLSPATARTMRGMLEAAASPEGTAPRARTAGYRVAGKTGTARKLKGGQYVNAYVASFAGFAPASDPRIVVAVMVDEPGAGVFYGGDVAGPVFAQITAGALRTLAVMPDAAVPPSPAPGTPSRPVTVALREAR